LSNFYLEKEETIRNGNTKTISDLKLSADETTLFSGNFSFFMN